MGEQLAVGGNGRAAALALALLAQACGGARAPGLGFERVRVDVGRLFAGPEIPLAFPFVNGPADLRLDEIETSCGCVAPELWLDGGRQALPATVPAGASGEIRATYRTAGYSGRKLTGLTLRGAGPGLPQVLEVDSILDSWLELDPPVLKLGALAGESEVAIEVRVRGRQPCRLLPLLGGSPELRVEGLPSAGLAAEHLLRVVVLPSAEQGPHVAFLNLGADNGYSVRLPVSFEIQGKLWTRPGSMLLLGELPHGAAGTTAVEVGVREGSLDPPAAVLEGLEALRIEVLALEPGSRYRVNLTLPDDLPAGAFSAVLRLRLRHRLDGRLEESERTLRLLGIVRKPD